MDDVRAVMDATGSARAALLGSSEGCAMSALFAATYPERVSKLILFGGYVQRRDLPDNWEELAEQRVRLWGTGAMIKTVAPKFANIPAAVAGFAKFERLSASPGAVRSFTVLNWSIDVSSVLPTVRVPTLVLHRKDDIHVSIKLGRELAAQIPGARMIEYPGSEHAFFTGGNTALLGDIEEFVTGHRDGPSNEFERFLATVLFTDIVDSTRSAAEIGDQAWRRLLDTHDELASLMIKRHGGTLIRSTGDGILATFDGPGRAVRCAWHSDRLRNRSACHCVRACIPAK